MKKQNLSFRKFFIHFLIVATFFLVPPQSKAQEIITTGASVAKGVYTAAKWTHEHWTVLKWTWSGMPHRWWACIYKDGFITYNNFRSYRTSMDAYNYFVKGRGDCDAVYGNRGNHICYESPMQAKRYTEQHGEIQDIQYQDNSGRYHSVYEY